MKIERFNIGDDYVCNMYIVGEEGEPCIVVDPGADSQQLTNALAKLGYIDPSPVQKAIIPKALRGVSLLAQSETGSGKTHAFLIPLIEKIDMNLNRPQAIVISPTRELARQTYEFAFEFTRPAARSTKKSSWMSPPNMISARAT